MEKKKFWHIDYLLSKKDVRLVDIYLSERRETDIVKFMQTVPKLKPHIKGFGSSDTNNPTHLFFTRRKNIKKTAKEVLMGF